MKKILTIALMVCLGFSMSAQISIADAQKKLAAAEKNAENPKNQAKVATWLNLANAYYNLYLAEKGSGIINVDRKTNELATKEHLVSEGRLKDREGVVHTKLVYDTHSDYYDRSDVLKFIEVTKDVVAEPLVKCCEAIAKAVEVDPQGKKTKDINALLTRVSQTYYDAAIFHYTFNNAEKSAEEFYKAYQVKTKEPLCAIDTAALNNATIMATNAGRNDYAEGWLKEMLSLGIEEDGNVYVRLGAIAAEKGNEEEMLAYYETGFQKYPTNQGILVALINYYLSANKESTRLFDLIASAKQNDPTNPSLAYVEGNVYKDMKEYDKALEAYRQANEIDPNYEWGYIGIGLLYVDLANDYADKANNTLKDDEYEEFSSKSKENFRLALPAFEKAYEVTTDNSLKGNIVSYLKQIYFMFRYESDEMMKTWEKYNEEYKSYQQ